MDRDIGTMLREIVRVTFRTGPLRPRRRRWVARDRDAAPVRGIPQRVTRVAA